MRNAIVIILCLLSFGLFGQAISWNKPTITEIVLDNGLTVILNEDHGQPIVYGGVMIRAGGKDDPADATGMAHYMEHMLFKGTESMGTIDWAAEKPLIEKIIALYDELGKTESEEERKNIQKKINEASIEAGKYAIPNEMDKLLKGIGSTGINAGTGNDQTIYFNAFPANQMEKWLEMYSHRFHKPVFRGFQAELEVVYEEKNMYADMFQFRLFEEFNKYFFKQHPYGQQPLIGTLEHLKNPSLSKMYDFYNTWYVPSNMALVISGSFDTQSVIPMIKEKFGVWENKKLPERKVFEEKPFNGRELVEVKFTPIKIGMLGFRTAPAGHNDEIALELFAGLLSNSSGTGYLDKLSIDNKIMLATIFNIPYNDHGQSIVLFVPKIIGQKFINAENLIIDEIKRIANGDFDESLIETMKKQKYVEFMQSMETPEGKVLAISMYFSQNRSWKDIFEYPKKLMEITKEDIISVAKKYYGDNYLAFHSKMGFPKPTKIDKPGFEPIIANTEAESEFAKKFHAIPTTAIKENYVDFAKDVKHGKINNGTYLYLTNNEINSVFELKIKFGAGDKVFPKLKYASEILNLAGSGSTSVNDFKSQFAALGCNYSFSSDDSYFVVSIYGSEEKLSSAVKHIYGLLQNPNIDPDKIKVLYDGEKANRKMEKSEADNVADALFQWVRFGKESDYLDRLSLSEIKKLQVSELTDIISKVQNYEKTVHYSGTKNFDELSMIFNELWKNDDVITSNSPHIPVVNKYSENTIYLVNKPKATQSKIYFLINGEDFLLENAAFIDAHNLYFGGDFSGLVMQYVREYRSMAYSAGARYSTPPKQKHPSTFYGFIGTQSDKTNEAVALFDSLVRVMPEFPDRINFIKDYLVNSSSSSRPHFRDLSESLEKWLILGYKNDPAIEKKRKYEDLAFQDIIKFHTINLKDKPMVISIVGNAKRIDKKELAKYGKIVEIKEKSLFSK